MEKMERFILLLYYLGNCHEIDALASEGGGGHFSEKSLIFHTISDLIFIN